MKSFVVSQEELNRIDTFIAKQLAISRGLSATLIETGKVTRNAKIVSRSSTKINAGDKITIDFDQTKHDDIPEISLPILYEDDDCLVVEKPAGILTHSKGAFNPEPTVATFIAPKIRDMDGDRGGIVHRLDRVTSGVIICAKTTAAHSWLQKQFAQRRTKKTYIAVVEGQLDEPEAIVDMPIERNPKKPQTFRAGANGKTAQTMYKVISSNETYSLVQLKPHTGRTHQLRVHMAHLGHPIVGDVLYGAQPAERVFLHAASLEITLPNRTRKVFTSDVPEPFTTLVS